MYVPVNKKYTEQIHKTYEHVPNACYDYPANPVRAFCFEINKSKLKKK